MKRITLAGVLAGVLAMPAFGLDGTPSPNAPPILPAIKAPPDLQLCGYASCLPQDPNVERAANELLERSQQLRHDTDKLVAQANPGPTASVDPYIGTWKFNPEKSTCTCPLDKSETLTVTREGQNPINNVDGVDGQGQAFKRVYQHIYDGQSHSTTGGPVYDATAFTRVGNTLNAVRFKNGKVVAVGQGVIVPGRSYTFNEEGIYENQPYHYLYVYDRQ